MITLQLKNKHIYFALEAIWTELDYRFKYLINQLVAENDEDDYLQTIQVDRATLNQILVSVNNKPQGVAREINPEMFMAILPPVFSCCPYMSHKRTQMNPQKELRTSTEPY